MDILENLSLSLPGYTLVQLGQRECRDMLCLYNTNPEFSAMAQDAPPTLEDMQRDLEDLPEGVQARQKHYVGFYRKTELCAVLDYIEEYPEAGMVYIGLFMLDAKQQGRGNGRRIMERFFYVLRHQAIRKIRLAAFEGNEKAIRFWNSLGFRETGRTARRAEGGKEWNLIVMDKLLREE